jgi:hypothetical protein
VAVSSFNPGSTFDAAARAIQLSSDNSVLYVGGDFTGKLYALDVSDGSISQNFGSSPNASVRAFALSSDGATLYIGGSFGEITGGTSETTIGEGAPFNVTTGEIATTFAMVSTTVADGFTIYASIPDGLGGWYIGGSFTHVGGVAQNGLAHILSDGTLDTAFAPTIDTANGGQVKALALSSDGDTLYIGGYLVGGVNSTIRNGAAALNTSDGSLVAGFNPNLNSLLQNGSGSVQSLALSSDDSVIYVGGTFDCVGDLDKSSCLGDVRNNMASFNTSDGSLVAGFDPNVTSTISVLALSSDDATVYAAGAFSTVNGATARKGVAAFATSGIATAFDVGFTSFGGLNSLALSSDNSILYVGGYSFTTDGLTNYSVGGFNTSDGTSSGFQEGFLDTFNGEGGAINTMALSPDNSILYVGGFFDCSGDLDAFTCDETRNNFAAITVADGVLTSFAPSFSDAVRTISETQNGEIYVGGSFTILTESLGGTFTRDKLAAIDTSDLSVTDFDPDLPGAPGSGGVYSLALTSDDEALYAGGFFTEAGDGDFPQGGLRGFDTATSDALAFDSSLQGYSFGVYTLALTPDDAQLSVGGSFKSSSYFFGPPIIESGNLAIFAVEPAREDRVGGDGSNNLGRTDDNGLSLTTNQIVRGSDEALKAQIQALIAQINALRARLGLPPVGGTNPPGAQGGTLFARNLTIGSTGPDVKALQIYLNTHGFILATTGPGSPGHETNLFGALTRDALAKFQAAKGISPAAGYFGPLTRAYVNAHP